MLPTRLIQTDHCSISSLRHMNGQIRRRRPFFCTLPRHASFNTVRLSPRSDFLLARVHAPPFTGFWRRRWITSVIPSTHSRAHFTHVEKRVTIAQPEFAVVFRHSASHVENSLRRFANAGQTRDTRTRVVKHTCASLRQEDHTRQSVLKHPTAFAQSPLYS